MYIIIHNIYIYIYIYNNNCNRVQPTVLNKFVTLSALFIEFSIYFQCEARSAKYTLLFPLMIIALEICLV